VNSRMLCKLYKDNDLSAFVTAQARRHFSCIEDQEDVIQEVWERYTGLSRPPRADQVRPLARRVIHAAYMRKWRRRKQECDESVNGARAQA